jgi:hypothetical protein
MHLKCVLVRENLELRIQKGFLKGSIQSICHLNAQKLIKNSLAIYNKHLSSLVL